MVSALFGVSLSFFVDLLISFTKRFIDLWELSQQNYTQKRKEGEIQGMDGNFNAMQNWY